MMRTTRRGWVLPVAVFGVTLGCGAANTSRQALNETTTVFHDDLRWGRLPSAEGSVDPRMRGAFTAHHRHWGTTVQVMDVEVEHLRVASSRAMARLRVVWTRGVDTTDVRESVVEENWESQGGTWLLRDESVIGGDPGLFGTPETPTPAATGRAS